MSHLSSKSFAIGVVSLIGSLMCFSILDTTNKYLMSAVPLLMIMWFRYTAHTCFSVVYMLPKRGRALLQTKRLKLQVARGFLLFISSLLAFISIQRMPVAEFAAIAMLTPLMVTVLSHFFLKEHVSIFRYLCVLGGLLGALIIVRPGGNLKGLDAVYPLALSLTNAVYQVLTSYISRSEDPLSMHLYTGLVGFVICSALVGWSWSTDMSLQFWLLMCLSGVTGTLGHYLLILGFSKAPANRLAPYLYLQIVFSWFAGWVVFGYNPHGLELVGICLIGFFGVAAAYAARNPQESIDVSFRLATDEKKTQVTASSKSSFKANTTTEAISKTA